MPLSQQTPRFEINDGRVKILWIDDLYEQIVPTNLRDEAEWFALTCASGPSDIRTLLDEGIISDTKGGSKLLDYSLRGFPFDVYLTDFRLCDKKNGGCVASDAHLAAGLHAPAAGFLLGLLTALRWPAHPQSIIPYSAYDEEFGQIWKLSHSVCPPSVNVVWNEGISKGKRDPYALLKYVGPTFRASITKATVSGVLQILFKERDRWEATVSSAAETVNARELVWFVGQYGLRPFLLGALFYDQLDKKTTTVPAAAVREWLAQLPINDPLEREARRLAAFYWTLRSSEVSKDVYALIRRFKSGLAKPADFSPPPTWPWLFEFTRDRENKHLLRRLTVLFLVILEHASRVRLRSWDLSQNPTDLLGLIASVRETRGITSTEALKMVKDVADEFELTQELEKLLAEYKSPNVPEESLIEGARCLVMEGDVVQLLDPLPGAWDACLSLDSGKKIGRRLARMNPEFNVTKLLNGDGSTLTAGERLAAQRYIREMLPRSEDWPAWLDGRG